jgi:hypothetical protein
MSKVNFVFESLKELTLLDLNDSINDFYLNFYLK